MPPLTGPHIEGRTCYGDNVEDEWFIVYLLTELTRADPELVVKLDDSDGEFLLIEAAEHLPKWASPDNCENRVYLFQAEVHLIPLKRGPIPAGTPIVPEAVRALRSYKNDCRLNDKVQQAISKRIGGYPQNIRTLQQRTICFVPAAVAAILNHEPNLISAAVAAFHERDPIDMAACKVMKYFPPENRVKKTVTLTRCMYGQLVGQKYTPDRKIGWDIPPANAPNFKAYDLGMKIACGFEILASTVKSRDRKAASTDNLEELEQDHRWQRFVNNLENNGYFQKLLKGSAGHTKLLKEAQAFYLTSVVDYAKNSKKVHATRPEIGARILQLLETLEVDYEKLKRQAKDLVEDDDRWMHVTPEDFDELLKQKFLGK